MSRLTDKERIYNLYVCSQKIKFYISGYTKSQFDNDPKTKDAIHYVLIILGKNLLEITKDTKRNYLGFPSFFELLGVDGSFDQDDLWDILKNKDQGLIQFLDKFEKMHALEERNSDEVEEQKRNLFQSLKDCVNIEKELDRLYDYKYPIKTQHSVMTVKNKLTRS